MEPIVTALIIIASVFGGLLLIAVAIIYIQYLQKMDYKQQLYDARVFIEPVGLATSHIDPTTANRLCQAVREAQAGDPARSDEWWVDNEDDL